MVYNVVVEMQRGVWHLTGPKDKMVAFTIAATPIAGAPATAAVTEEVMEAKAEEGQMHPFAHLHNQMANFYC